MCVAVEVSGIVLRVLRLRVSEYCTLFTLQTSFITLLLKGGGGLESKKSGIKVYCE